MTTTTARLCVGSGGAVRHDLTAATVDNDLADLIDRDLVQTGLIAAADFERVFVEVVLSTDPDPDRAWAAFYRNTLAALATGGAPGATNAGMAPVHERTVALAQGSVIELGCCFGFLSLRLAAHGHPVTAVDLHPGTVDLLARIAPALGIALTTSVGDALDPPLPDGCADTVLAVHLLEHLPRGADATVLGQMLRVARRRVVVAVPFEDDPNPTWGHVRTFDLDDLDALGATSGLRYRVEEYHGGWLIIDR